MFVLNHLFHRSRRRCQCARCALIDFRKSTEKMLRELQQGLPFPAIEFAPASQVATAESAVQRASAPALSLSAIHCTSTRTTSGSKSCAVSVCAGALRAKQETGGKRGRRIESGGSSGNATRPPPQPISSSRTAAGDGGGVSSNYYVSHLLGGGASVVPQTAAEIGSRSLLGSSGAPGTANVGGAFLVGGVGGEAGPTSAFGVDLGQLVGIGKNSWVVVGPSFPLAGVGAGQSTQPQPSIAIDSGHRLELLAGSHSDGGGAGGIGAAALPSAQIFGLNSLQPPSFVFAPTPSWELPVWQRTLLGGGGAGLYIQSHHTIAPLASLFGCSAGRRKLRSY